MVTSFPNSVGFTSFPFRIASVCGSKTLRTLPGTCVSPPMTRADLHISRSRHGELFITSRQDGTIRMLVPDSGGGGADSAHR
ncbi:MAG: hypothetical protein HY701_03545 [Gemmatimonadetes bacterium]|nr:hypothetical protein [Gemmatimonadota bacterium]